MRLFDLMQVDMVQARRQRKTFERNLRELERQEAPSAQDPDRAGRRAARNSFQTGTHIP